ncbi:MAG: transposase [Akkermansiaceae bacterium]|nr:transposase [Akkermansiaceae bacterium]
MSITRRFIVSRDFSAKRAGYPADLIVHWIHQAIELVLPVAQAIRAETLACDYLQVDETTVRYLRPGTGKSWMGYLWQARCPGGGGVFYHWGVGRSRDELVECIGEDFAGHVQCDAYGVYETYARTRPEVRLIACLAHIRRGFVDSPRRALPARGVGGPFDRATIPDRGRPAGAESRPRPARE